MEAVNTVKACYQLLHRYRALTSIISIPIALKTDEGHGDIVLKLINKREININSLVHSECKLVTYRINK